MSKNKGQVSLAGAAQAAAVEKQKGSPWKWVGIGVGLVVLLVAGILLFNAVDEEEKPSLSAREMAEYTYTADDIAGNVAYYLVGVTGENIGDPMDMLAVMCYDRKAGSVSVVQIPVATYIDKGNGFAATSFLLHADTQFLLVLRKCFGFFFPDVFVLIVRVGGVHHIQTVFPIVIFHVNLF